MTAKRRVVRRRPQFGGINDSPTPDNPHEALLTVTYWGISILSSRTMWVNAGALVIATLSLTEVVTIVPPALMPMFTAGVAALNLWLRTITVRPVAFSAPGTVTPVDVPKLDPPTPIVTD